jgi:hypothetical protein
MTLILFFTDLLDNSMFHGSDDEYKIEPGTQENIEVLQLLKIPGYLNGPRGEEEEDINTFNDDLGALADKE